MKMYNLYGWSSSGKPNIYTEARLKAMCILKKKGWAAVEALEVGQKIDVEFKTHAGWITYQLERTC